MIDQICKLLHDLLTVDPRQRIGSIPGHTLRHHAWSPVLTNLKDDTEIAIPTSDAGTDDEKWSPHGFLRRMIPPPRFSLKVGKMSYAARLEAPDVEDGINDNH